MKSNINSKLIGGLLSALFLICASSFASGKGESIGSLTASGKVRVETSGTGETIGHIADLKIQNLTDRPLTCAVPPMILESGSGKNQHYACPRGQSVPLAPQQSKTVPMNGVCLNRNKPPVGKGISGDLVINEANPAIPQNPNSHLPATDASRLLQICTSKYDAAEKLQKEGALKNLPYHDPQKQKDIVVQWSTWTDPVICQMTGSPPATKEDLRKVVYKQVEEQGPMTPEKKKKVDQGIDAIFEKVELTSARAKDLEKTPFSQVELTGEEAKSVSPTTSALPVAAVVQEQQKPRTPTPTPTPTPEPCCVIKKIEFKIAGSKETGEQIEKWADKLKDKLKEIGGEGAEQIGEAGSAIITGYKAILALTRPLEIYATLGKGFCKGKECEVKEEVECRLIPRNERGDRKVGLPGGVNYSENEAWPNPKDKDWWDTVGKAALARALANILKYCECDDGSPIWPPKDAKPVAGCK